MLHLVCSFHPVTALLLFLLCTAVLCLLVSSCLFFTRMTFSSNLSEEERDEELLPVILIVFVKLALDSAKAAVCHWGFMFSITTQRDSGILITFIDK